MNFESRRVRRENHLALDDPIRVADDLDHPSRVVSVDHLGVANGDRADIADRADAAGTFTVPTCRPNSRSTSQRRM